MGGGGAWYGMGNDIFNRGTGGRGGDFSACSNNFFVCLFIMQSREIQNFTNYP